MSEQRIPLFPLNTVLFPSMPLPLHIFEERYKRMVTQCIQSGEPFGVILIRDGSEVGDSPLPETVGTLAQIHAVNQLNDGRLNILTVGTERFRLLEYTQTDGECPSGRIEPFQDDPCDPNGVSTLAADTASLFGEYFRALVSQAGIDMPEYDLPPAADDLSFVVAAVLQIPNARRQALLEMTDTCSRLTEERQVLGQQIGMLANASKRTVISAKPVDLKATLAELSRN